MKVDICFKVECTAEQSLQYKDDNHSPTEMVMEYFMNRVILPGSTSISTLQQSFTGLYAFIHILGISDLDGELSDPLDTLNKLWKNYQDYISDDEEQQQEQQKVEEDDNISLSIIISCKYIGTSLFDIFQFHKQLRENPINNDFKQILEGIEFSSYDLNTYHINTLDGSYKFNGHSYDSVEGNKVFVDQLLTSSEKYELINERNGKMIELSTQQCIIVDQLNNSLNSKFQPYIMVNKTGLSQLEKLENLERLKVKIGNVNTVNKINDAINFIQPNDSIIQQTREEKNQDRKRICDAINELISIANDTLNHNLLKSTDNDDDYYNDYEIIKEIITDILPFLYGLTTDMLNESIQEPQKVDLISICKMIVKYPKKWISYIINNWISNGLIFQFMYTVFKSCFIEFILMLILSKFKMENNLTTSIVIISLFLTDDIVELIGKIGNEGGVPYFPYIHNILRNIKNVINRIKEIILWGICHFCITFKRPVYVGNNSNEQQVDEYMLRAGLLSRIGLFTLRFVQDVVLIVLTVVPTVADVYKKTLRDAVEEEQQKLQKQRDT